MKKKENGSMTVEASICLPVFLFAMILIGYLGQMIRCQDEVQSALSRVAVSYTHLTLPTTIRVYMSGVAVCV